MLTASYRSRNFEEFQRLTFPSDYSKPKPAEEKKETEKTASASKENKVEPSTALHPTSKLLKKDENPLISYKSAQEEQPTQKRQSKLIHRTRGSRLKPVPEVPPKTVSQPRKARDINKRLLSKVSIKASDKSVDLNAVEEHSEYDTSNSRRRGPPSKQNTIKDKLQFGSIKGESWLILTGFYFLICLATNNIVQCLVIDLFE